MLSRLRAALLQPIALFQQRLDLLVDLASKPPSCLFEFAKTGDKLWGWDFAAGRGRSGDEIGRDQVDDERSQNPLARLFALS
jgi:hypothetical protein